MYADKIVDSGTRVVGRGRREREAAALHKGRGVYDSDYLADLKGTERKQQKQVSSDDFTRTPPPPSLWLQECHGVSL
ncbi:hypothetical protein E2C01_064452 [Portunus trituberculatus]|uniref:Uncharacterized protein n=1 Tax=Portunus trituberculatus TaxID=210409 RepID=A0A5B7HD22_PORTR|nr:hypothetical protein [Portunus trituberculatus]